MICRAFSSSGYRDNKRNSGTASPARVASDHQSARQPASDGQDRFICLNQWLFAAAQPLLAEPDAAFAMTKLLSVTRKKQSRKGGTTCGAGESPFHGGKWLVHRGNLPLLRGKRPFHGGNRLCSGGSDLCTGETALSRGNSPYPRGKRLFPGGNSLFQRGNDLCSGGTRFSRGEIGFYKGEVAFSGATFGFAPLRAGPARARSRLTEQKPSSHPANKLAPDANAGRAAYTF